MPDTVTVDEIRLPIPDFVTRWRPTSIVRDAARRIGPATFHHVSVIGEVEYHDSETFGSDEHGSRPFRVETTLSTDDIGVPILSYKEGFGGEERVEIDMLGSLREDGVLSATLAVRFYEGATEGTTELEEARTWSAVVLPNANASFSIHLANDEDDWATARGSLINRVIG